MLKKLHLFSVLILSGSLAAQSVSPVDPSLGFTGQTLPIIISGQNTTFTQGSLSLMLKQGSQSLSQGSNTGIGFFIANDTLLVGSLGVPGNANLGFYDLFVNSGSSTLSRINAFEVLPNPNPLVSVAPTGSKPGQNVNVSFTVTGANFKSQMAENIERVWLNLGPELITNIQNIQVINSTTFSADVSIPSSATNGDWDVNVYTDGGNMYRSPTSFTIDNTFSRKEFTTNNFNIFPNPVGDEFKVETPAGAEGLSFRIINLSGKVESGIKSEWEGNTLKVTTKTLASGSYLIQFTQDDKVLATKKLVKK